MATSAPLADQAERLAALTSHERTLLVEAGAGSGKTAVLAGRIAMMLLQGVRPESIAAVTFTELAASELLHRVRDFVSRLLHQDIPMELRLALPDGLSPAQLAALREAQASIDDITCSTIHGFCQRLIRPYPVEASIDPGAAIMDRDQAELAFHDVVDDWLRQQLGSEASGLLAELMLVDVAGTLGTVKSILRLMKQHEDLQPPPAGPVPAALAAFKSAVAAYSRTVADAGFEEAETFAWMEAFRGMAQNLDAFDVSTDSGLVGVLQSKPHASLCTEKGTFRAFQKKTKWEAAATATGRSKAEGGRIAGEAKEAHGQCCDAWDALLASTSGQVAAGLLPLLRPAVERMQEYKRSAALMDFDDLLRSARDMLRNHSGVRDALAQKYQHVLVDEFQDTDPIQSEIFWRLCGSPPTEGDPANWRSFQIRPGALFIVGDPKQAIYRFRGADVGAYIEARNSLRAQDEGSILSISVNFRSCAPILDHVNNCFAQPLAQTGQPGFIAMQALHAAREGLPSVVALNIAVADENGKA
ncbi:MAG: UvrD-helicase domain-containing protein, partial [Burkholderiaceae bacterium]|nr:UvrD-helicase domain-containing protein [Burkholderiaceae bacterium]